jgi:hypothetical protein
MIRHHKFNGLDLLATPICLRECALTRTARRPKSSIVRRNTEEHQRGHARSTAITLSLPIPPPAFEATGTEYWGTIRGDPRGRTSPRSSASAESGFLIAAPPRQGQRGEGGHDDGKTGNSEARIGETGGDRHPARRREPLKAKEIAKSVIDSGRCEGLKGKTPEATISAMLAVGSKLGGPFKRVDKGSYTLAETASAATTPTAEAKPATAKKRAHARRPAAQKPKRQPPKPRATQSR